MSIFPESPYFSEVIPFIRSSRSRVAKNKKWRTHHKNLGKGFVDILSDFPGFKEGR